MSQRNAEFERDLEAVSPALIRAARVLCWSADDVDDVVQETVMRAFESYSTFGRRSSLLTWMYAILARVASAANQKRRRQIPAGYALGRPDCLPPVDVGVSEDESARAVVDAIRALPQRQREMVTLHFLEDLTYGQIAEALGVAVGTVKATVFAAKMSLRDALAAQVEVKQR